MTDAQRILLADDDPAMLRLLEVNFRLEGFAVETATRGDDALERAATCTHAAIVLDVLMPGLDGVSVARAVRETPGCDGVPIVLLTARSPEDILEDAGGIPGLVRLHKPFDPADLIALVRNLTRSSSA